MSDRPELQFVHTSAIEGANWPVVHSSHGVDADRSVSAVPATQATQAVACRGAYWPIEQSTHGDAGCESSSARPGTHASHCDAPGSAAVPTGHAAHVAAVVAANALEARPARQRVHRAAAEGAHSPLPHRMQASASGSGAKRPAKQRSHAAATGASENRPGAHAKQDSAPTAPVCALARPRPQAPQLVAPSLRSEHMCESWKLGHQVGHRSGTPNSPAAQGVHTCSGVSIVNFLT